MFRPIFLLLCAFLSHDLAAQTSEERPHPGIEEIYLAKDDGRGGAGDASDEFITTDVPIYCVVKLASTLVADVQMKLIAVNVAGVKPETKVVSASFMTNGTHDRVNFMGRPAGLWIPGKYRVDIFVNKSLAGSKKLEIRKAAFRPKSDTDAIKQRNNSKPRLSNRIGKN